MLGRRHRCAFPARFKVRSESLRRKQVVVVSHLSGRVPWVAMGSNVVAGREPARTWLPVIKAGCAACQSQDGHLLPSTKKIMSMTLARL